MQSTRRNRWSRSRFHIRTRIALWITVISTGLLLFLSLSVLGVFQQQLIASLDQTLTLRATTNRQLIDFSTSPPSLQPSATQDRELAVGEAVLRLYSSDGVLLIDASPVTGLTDEERDAAAAAVASGQDVYRTIDLADDEDYRVLASLVDAPGANPVVLVTGLERSRVNSPLRLLRIILAIAVPLTAGGAGLGGYWVAQRALQPVSAMATTARHITGGDLKRRVPGADADDELGHLASTLNSMIGRLSDTVDRERRFTADASHELRTPLAAIEASIDVTLAHPRPGDEYRRVLTVIRAQTRRLNLLANQLLLLSRLDADEVRRGFTTVDLTGLLEAVGESFQDSHPDLEIDLRLPSLSVTVHGDVELLARAVMNLLENAAVHGGSSVRIGIHLTTGDHRAQVTVSDTGPGIPADVGDQIFQRFRRGDQARSGSGTGLGLAIVQSIVAAHQGTIELDDDPQVHGARFVIRLPGNGASEVMSERG